MSEMTSASVKGKSKRKASAATAPPTRNTRLRTSSSLAGDSPPSRIQSGCSDAHQEGEQGEESLEVKREMMGLMEEHRRDSSQDRVDDRTEKTPDEDTHAEVKEEGLSEEEWGRGHQFLSKKFGQFRNAINHRADCISENVEGVMTGIAEQTARLDAIEPAANPGRLRGNVNNNTARIGGLQQPVEDHTTRMRSVESGLETMRTTMTDTERQLRADMQRELDIVRASVEAERSARVALEQKDKDIAALRKALEDKMQELLDCKAELATAKTTHGLTMAQAETEKAALRNSLQNEQEAEIVQLRKALKDRDQQIAGFLATSAQSGSDNARNGSGSLTVTNPSTSDALASFSMAKTQAKLQEEKERHAATMAELAAKHAAYEKQHAVLSSRCDMQRRRLLFGEHPTADISAWESALNALREAVDKWGEKLWMVCASIGEPILRIRSLLLCKMLRKFHNRAVKTRMNAMHMSFGDDMACKKCKKVCHWSSAMGNTGRLLFSIDEDRHRFDTYLKAADTIIDFCSCTLADVAIHEDSQDQISRGVISQFVKEHERPIIQLEGRLQQWTLHIGERQLDWTGTLGIIGIALTLSSDAGITTRAIARSWSATLPKEYSDGLSAPLKEMFDNIGIVSSIVEEDW